MATKKQLLAAHRNACMLADMAFRQCMQAKCAWAAGDITKGEFDTFLKINSRLHTSYAIEARDLIRELNERKRSRNILHALLLAWLILALALWAAWTAFQ